MEQEKSEVEELQELIQKSKDRERRWATEILQLGDDTEHPEMPEFRQNGALARAETERLEKQLSTLVAAGG